MLDFVRHLAKRRPSRSVLKSGWRPLNPVPVSLLKLPVSPLRSRVGTSHVSNGQFPLMGCRDWKCEGWVCEQSEGVRWLESHKGWLLLRGKKGMVYSTRTNL